MKKPPGPLARNYLTFISLPHSYRCIMCSCISLYSTYTFNGSQMVTKIEPESRESHILSCRSLMDLVFLLPLLLLHGGGVFVTKEKGRRMLVGTCFA